MSKQLKLRRGTTLEHSTFTGAEGELTIDMTKDTAVVHDGVTAGGFPLARESAVSSVGTSISDHISSTTAHTAANLVNVAAGNIVATTVQAAINELDTEKQPVDATLTALAGVATTADTMIYATAADTFSTATLTSFGRSLIDDATAGDARSTLGISATNTPVTPVGNIAATDVQAALAELDSEKTSINDTVASLTTAYSGTKTQIMHDAQAIAISNLAGASATIHNHVSQPIPEAPAAFVDLTWTNDQASTNTNILDLGTNAFILKQNGSYNFYNTLTYYRLSDGSPLTVTYELYDSVSMAVLGTYTQALDMIAGTKITVPMNALLIITGLTAGQTKSVKVRMQSTTVNGTVELFDFHSILALSSVSIVPTIDAVPTDGSANLVSSNGVFDAIAVKQNTLTFDSVPTNGSTNPVTSDGVFDALVGKLALAGGTMTGAITALRETKVAMGANDIDLSVGNLFTKTISGATTLTVSNWLATGNANSFILELTNGGSAAVTWFAGVKWAGGTAPTLTAAGVDIIGFYSHDGGTTVRGMVLSKDSK